MVPSNRSMAECAGQKVKWKQARWQTTPLQSVATPWKMSATSVPKYGKFRSSPTNVAFVSPMMKNGLKRYTCHEWFENIRFYKILSLNAFDYYEMVEGFHLNRIVLLFYKLELMTGQSPIGRAFNSSSG